MAFTTDNQKRRALSAYASVPVDENQVIEFFKHATTQTKAQVLAAGAFNLWRDRLAVGDIIDVVCGIGGTVDDVRVRVTAVPATGNVTTVDVSV